MSPSNPLERHLAHGNGQLESSSIDTHVLPYCPTIAKLVARHPHLPPTSKIQNIEKKIWHPFLSNVRMLLLGVRDCSRSATENGGYWRSSVNAYKRWRCTPCNNVSVRAQDSGVRSSTRYQVLLLFTTVVLGTILLATVLPRGIV